MELLHCVKTEGKICCIYEQSKMFMEIVKRMWKDSKFKDFILFVYYYLELLCYNSCLKMKQYFKNALIILITFSSPKFSEK